MLTRTTYVEASDTNVCQFNYLPTSQMQAILFFTLFLISFLASPSGSVYVPLLPTVVADHFPLLSQAASKRLHFFISSSLPSLSFKSFDFDVISGKYCRVMGNFCV